MVQSDTKLVYIIPAHAFPPVREDLFRAVDSVRTQTARENVRLVISCSESLYDELKDTPQASGYDPDVVYFAVSSDDSSYPSLVNAALAKISSENLGTWVSILEYDDELTPKATEIFLEYQKADKLEAEMFCGLALLTKRIPDSQQERQLVGMQNETAWAHGVVEEQGVYDFNAMLRANFIFLNGSYIKLSVFDQIGYFKPSLKAFYDYEFVLRVVYNGIVVRSIPKATHYHEVDGGEFSFIKSLSQEERDFWLSTARKEYFFDEDRNVAYSKKE